MTASQELAKTVDEFIKKNTTKYDIYHCCAPTLYWCVEQLQHNGQFTQAEALDLLGIQESADETITDIV